MPVDAGVWGIHALPYGIFQLAEEPARVGVRIGDSVLDLAGAAALHAPQLVDALRQPSLNVLMAGGADVWSEMRELATRWLSGDEFAASLSQHLHPLASATMRLPFVVADYVDFYSSRHHAENLGRMFRPDQPALTPNWLHLPIGYHGRAGTVVVSGTSVTRPTGQRRPDPSTPPDLGPSVRLDIEAEVGFVVGTPTTLGSAVPIGVAAEYVFGVVLVNDWSARDLQAWEYVPLGPFLGKSFATTISAWVLPLAALDHARIMGPSPEVPLLPYLCQDDPWGLDIELKVQLNGHLVSTPPFKDMYWTLTQQLAHLTRNGASLRVGDLYASGTVSGPDAGQYGSFIEMSDNGRHPIRLPDGSERSFLDDGDVVVITGSAPGPHGERVGLGEVTGKISPAR